MLIARLVVECMDQAELDMATSGTVDLQVSEMDIGVAGELIRTQLRPLSIEALSLLAAVDPPEERQGPLVRVFLPRPQGGL